MRKLLIKNFGPVRNEKGMEISISPVTVIIGEQGSGKSTIAKLISEFSWLEKSIESGDFTKKEVVQYNRFRKNHCAYHGIQNYFSPDTYIRFTGDKFVFEYKEGHLSITDSRNNGYLRPQVMYFPAERNLVSAIEGADKIKRLPGAVATLLDEYNRALRESKDGLINLPINGYSILYDKLNKVTWLNGKGMKVRTQEAASGFQSLIPLSVVSNYFDSLVTNNSSQEVVIDSAAERQRIEKTIQSILRDKTIDSSIKAVLLKELGMGKRNRRFINVVEEPEQNLFPMSQKFILFELLRIKNSIQQNELVFTTHSPYLINYLSLAIKAYSIQNSISGDHSQVLESIVPAASRVPGNQVSVYVTSSDGSISMLDKYDGMPSDNNALNALLEDSNVLFEKLLDLEEQSYGA